MVNGRLPMLRPIRESVPVGRCPSPDVCVQFSCGEDVDGISVGRKEGNGVAFCKVTNCFCKYEIKVLDLQYYDKIC